MDSSLGVRAAPLLEAPEGVAIYKVGGAAVGRVLGVGEGPGEVAVRVEELPHLARVVDSRAAALPEPQRIVERVRLCEEPASPRHRAGVASMACR